MGIPIATQHIPIPCRTGVEVSALRNPNRIEGIVACFKKNTDGALWIVNSRRHVNHEPAPKGFCLEQKGVSDKGDSSKTVCEKPKNYGKHAIRPSGVI